MEQECNRTAAFFQALGDECRLHLLRQLCSGPKCGRELQAAAGLKQTTLAHHMKLLCGAGLVQQARDGKFTRYRLPQDLPEQAAALLGGWLGGAQAENARAQNAPKTSGRQPPLIEGNAAQTEGARRGPQPSGGGSDPPVWLL